MEPASPSRTSDPATAGSAGRGRIGGDLGIRLLSSAILIPFALAVAWWGGLPAYLLAGLVALVVFAEWALVVGQSTALLPERLEVVCGALLVLCAAPLAGLAGAGAGVALAAVATLLVGLWSRSAWLAGGVVYAGLFSIAVSAVRSDATLGLQAVIILLVLVWATDSAAYVIGRMVGGPKLWPRVSPKKTWSGSVGGLLVGSLAAALMAFFLHIPVGPILVALLVALSVVSQIGDMIESAVKRRFGKKDASGIIPGHGGMMDRIDGLIFAATLALAIGWLHGGEHHIGEGLLLW